MALASDHVTVLVGGLDLTGDSHQIRIDDRRDMQEVTALADTTQGFLPGKRQVAVEHGGYLNPNAGGSHAALRAGNVQGVVSVLLGQNAAPGHGDPVYSLYAQQGRYETAPQAGQSAAFQAHFANAGEVGGWGVLLARPDVVFSASTNGTPHNHGGPTTGGATAFLHVVQAAANDTYTFRLEGSATGAFSGEQMTLVTFGLNASAVGGERQGILGRIPQYVRAVATNNGGVGDPIRIAVSLVRGPDAEGYVRSVLNIAPNELAAYWPLFEKGGTQAHELTAGMRHGTYSGATPYQGYGPGGLPAPAFDGVNDEVYAPGPDIANRSFTVAAWLKPSRVLGPTDSRHPICIVSAWEIGKASWWWMGGTGQISVDIYGGYVASLDNALTLGVWQPVVFVYDQPSTTGRIYVWGQQVAVNETLGAYTGGAPTVHFGQKGDAYYYKGQAAHVAIWQRALDAAQIAQYGQG